MSAAEAAASPARSAPLLSVNALSVTYGDGAPAVDGLSFRVGRGEIVALLGPNGAGKTTTLRAISGFLPVDRAAITAGNIVFDAVGIEGSPPHRIARRGIAILSERDKVFTTLSVEQNLALGALANPAPAEVAELRSLVDRMFPILSQRGGQQAGYLSGGERQMLAIGRALLSGPKLLMVDELSLGLAPRIVGELIEVLRRLRQERGLSILLVEQSAQVAFEIADYVHVLSVGKSVMEGRADVLRNSADFVDSYLGLGAKSSS